MISTVTAITVAALSSSASSASLLSLGSSLGLTAVVTLLVLVMQKELLSHSVSPEIRAFSSALNVGVVPLLVAFGMILAAQFVALMK